MQEGYKNCRETLYSSKGKVVYVVRKPCNIYRLQGNPYGNYRFSPKSVNHTVQESMVIPILLLMTFFTFTDSYIMGIIKICKKNLILTENF